MEIKILFMRHGESVDDVENCYGGAADFCLTEGGKEGARLLATYIRLFEPQLIFASPLARAMETAEIISSELGGGLEIIRIDEFAERNSFGILTGVNRDRAAQLFKRFLDRVEGMEQNYRDEVLGAEKFAPFCERVRSGFDAVIQRCITKELSRVAVVAHRGVIFTLLKHIVKVEQEVELGLNGTNVLEITPQMARLGCSSIEGSIAKPT